MLLALAAPAAAQQPDTAPPSSAPRPDPAPQVQVAPAPVAPAPTVRAPVATPAPTPRATATPSRRVAARRPRPKPEPARRQVRATAGAPPAVPSTRLHIDGRRLDDPALRAAALALLVAAAGSLALIVPLRRGVLR